VPYYTDEEIAGFRTQRGTVFCADCYYEAFGKYCMGDDVISTEESASGLAICDECNEQF